MKKKLKNVVIFLILLLSAITIVGSIYYSKEYPKQDFDVILFLLSAGAEKTSPDVINNVIKVCILPVIGLLMLLLLPTVQNLKNNKCLKIGKNKRNFQLYPIKIIANHRVIYIIIILIISLLVFIKCFRVDEYLKNRLQYSTIFEKYYVDGRKIDIKFPAKKRNLILILGESFENTVFSKDNGGAWDYSIMPELENLALENTNFSNTTKLGGPLQTYGSSYSAAGNIAITSGIPLKADDIFADANKYTGTGDYLGGVYSLR